MPRSGRRAADHGRTEPAVAGRGAREGAARFGRPSTLQRQARHGRHPSARDPARSRDERLEARREQRRQDAGRVADRRDGRAEVDVEERHDGRSAGRRGSAIRPRHHGRRSTRRRCRCARASTRPTSSALRVGQPARITLDSYPARAFDGRLEQLSQIGAISTMSNRVRTFLAVFSIEGTDPHLMPDLAAAIDVAEDRR